MLFIQVVEVICLEFGLVIVLFDAYRILRAQQEVVDNIFSSQLTTACNVKFPLSEELDMLLQRYANLPEVRAVQQSLCKKYIH